MRLSKEELRGITLALVPHVTPAKDQLFLFGSRTQEKRRGGDIDLLLIVSSVSHKNQLLEKKHTLLAALKEQIGDQKIDLLITDSTSAKKDPFIKDILPTALPIELSIVSP